MKYDISVVIPSFNSKKTITSTLQSLIKQTTSLKYEVIVVDSSSDDTSKIIKEEFPQIKLIHQQISLSAGEARNIGIDFSRSDKILFTDADTVVPSNWIDKMAKMLDEYDIAGGAVDNGTPKSFWGTIGYLLQWIRYFPSRAKINYDIHF